MAELDLSFMSTLGEPLYRMEEKPPASTPKYSETFNLTRASELVVSLQSLTWPS